MVLILTACTNTDTDTSHLETALETSQQAIQSLEASQASLEARILELESSIETLQSDLDFVHSNLFDGTVVFELIIGGERMMRTVPFRNIDDSSAFDLLISAFDVDYSTSEWGVFVNRIESMRPLYGQFISMEKNDAMMLEGIGTIDYEHGDVFSFELVWWDPLAQSVYEAMMLTLGYYETQPVSSLDYQVLLAFNALGNILDFEVSEVPEEGLSNQLKQAFKIAMLGGNLEAVAQAIYDQGFNHHIYSKSLMYMALSLSRTLDYSDFETEYFNTLSNLDFEDTDLDTLSMVLIALGLISYESEITTQIVDRILDDAYNNPFGDNAASFAMNILGLLSQGINPESIELVTSLIEYQTKEGLFYYQLGNEDADELFSTPQGFIALVMMHTYLNQGMGSVNPFDLKTE